MPIIGPVKRVANPVINEVDGQRLAVNLCDLDRLGVHVRQLFLGGKIDLTQIIDTDSKQFDEAAVAFTCDLLTAACVCDTLRSRDRKGKQYPTRIYLQRAKAWVKVPGHVILVKVVDGKCLLNSELFATTVEYVPLPAQKIF